MGFITSESLQLIDCWKAKNLKLEILNSLNLSYFQFNIFLPKLTLALALAAGLCEDQRPLNRLLRKLYR